MSHRQFVSVSDLNFSRFFTHYTGRGRYNVKCQVIGDSDTQVNEGFINNRKKGRSIPMAPGGSPMCCGSNTITEDSVLSDTGNFTRTATGGAFQVSYKMTIYYFQFYELNRSMLIYLGKTSLHLAELPTSWLPLSTRLLIMF